MSDKKGKKEKEIVGEFDNHIRDIRQQLNDQLKCLEGRLETEVAMVQEIQEFFRRKSEVELEYSRSLDKLVKQTRARQKAERQRREQWGNFSASTCLQVLLEITSRESHSHSVLGDVYGNDMVYRLNNVMEDSNRIFRRCRDIGSESHEDIMKVLHELQSAMKTYHIYQNESKQAEVKLKHVETQKMKVQQQLSGKSGSTSRKLKSFERQMEKRQAKYSENKLKALKARNEYLLCIDAANAALHKYFSDDISDLMDCMELGFINSVSRSMMMCKSSHEQQKLFQQTAVDKLNNCITNLDSRTDKQRFMETNNYVFMLPKKFEFQSYKGDEVRQISAQKPVQDDLVGRFQSMSERLSVLRLDNDEIWKTLETAEKFLMEAINVTDYDVASSFATDCPVPKSPHEVAKRKSDRMETETYYLDKFHLYTLSCNQLARLQAKSSAIQKALGEKKISPSGLGSRPPSLPLKPKTRRIGRAPLVGQPKLFAGSLEEYIEATGDDIPLVIKSCVRLINLYGLQHQGVFRVSGAQVEINDFKACFEKGEDPLVDVMDGGDVNSVAGVLKLYFRELREPLFPLHLFDELIGCSKIEESQVRVERVRDLIVALPRSVLVVMRYLFAFLNHLTEFSDENLMDAYNLATCFGPTLLPIPPDRDQVQYQSNVNEVIKTVITHHEEVFIDVEGVAYEKCLIENRDLEGTHDGMNSLHSDGESDDETEVFEAAALYDFDGRSERELSFKKGDILIIYSRVSKDWWEGCFNNREGIIPEKYISIKHLNDDKRSQVGVDEIGAVHSLPHRPLRSNSDDGQMEKSVSQPAMAVRETDIISVDSDELLITDGFPTLMQEPLAPEDFSASPSNEPLKEASIPSSYFNPAALSSDIDVALAEVMDGIKSLEMQQKSDKRMSLPTSKSKPKHTPDLVIDLPEGCSDSPPSHSGPDSPTLSAAETFALSNQGTLKKGNSLPHNINSSSPHPSGVVPEVAHSPAESDMKLSFSSSATIKNRVAQLEQLPTGLPLPGPPPVADKPRGKLKPPVMKKPGRPEAIHDSPKQ